MRVRGSDECSAGDERAPLCFWVLSAYDKVIGGGGELLEMADRSVALICLVRVGLMSFNEMVTAKKKKKKRKNTYKQRNTCMTWADHIWKKKWK